MSERWEVLVRWMDSHGLGAGPIVNVRPLSGGTQNEMIRFDRDGRAFVLRRPARSAAPEVGKVILREARVLAGLTGSGVPHAALLAVGEDESVFGTSFYLMEEVQGFCPAQGLPDSVASSRDAQRAMGLAMLEGLLALAHLDPCRVFADARTRGERWLARQPEQWEAQLEGYGSYERKLDGAMVAQVAAWLRKRRPPKCMVGLIHGDYHFANVLMAPAGAPLAAIVDWELATVGDPLLDLGHLLATWPGDGEYALTDRPAAPGLPAPDELVDLYLARSARDQDTFDWFRVLACYRLAALLEGTHARAQEGRAPAELGRTLHAMAVKLLRQALVISTVSK
jgi:aminoglycoside phosphotransferase (APT) family kinase protein